MKITQILISFLFMLIIGLPPILQFMGFSFGKNQSENRTIVSSPTLSFNHTKSAHSIKGTILGVYRDFIDYKNTFNSYYQDNFVLKPPLFDAYYTIQQDYLGLNPLPKKVVNGKDGWMFLGDSYSDVILESKSINNFSPLELEVATQNILDIRDWLKQKDIGFYFAVAPNKHSVYGDQLAIVQDDKPSTLEQLKEALQEKDFSLIDLKSKFDNVKDKRLFDKTNTHWNDLGAFLGTEALLEAISKDFPDVPVQALTDYTITTPITYQEDLTKLLNIQREEQKYILTHKASLVDSVPSLLSIPSNYRLAPKFELRYRSSKNKLKVLVFRDSFGSALTKFIKESFGESIFLWYLFDQALVEAADPDIVIFELVERDLNQLRQMEINN